MNPCERFKESILTDYIDGEIGQETRKDVEAHLRECPSCREFSFEVKKDLVTPFQRASREEVPEQIWVSLKERIEQEAQAKDPFKEFLSGLAESFSFPRLVPALGSLIIIIFIGLAVFQQQQTKLAKEKEQFEFLASLISPADITLETENNDLQTPLEQYFL